MRLDGRDLIGQFRALAPPRRPIPLQRWGLRRIVYAAALILVAFLVTPNVVSMFAPARAPGQRFPGVRHRRCHRPHGAVRPSRVADPLHRRAAGGLGSREACMSSVTAASSRCTPTPPGQRAVIVTMTPSCATEGWREEPSDVPALRRFVSFPDGPGRPSVRAYVGDGMCVTYQYRAGVSREVKRRPRSRTRCLQASWSPGDGGRPGHRADAVRSGGPVLRGRCTMNATATLAASLAAVLLRTVIGLRLAAVITSAVASSARHPPRVDDGAVCRRGRLGHGGRRVARAQRVGLGRRWARR